jgi:fatty acid desaturase
MGSVAEATVRLDERERHGLAGSPPLKEIVSHDGVRWLDYRKALAPRYAIVWRDLALCYAAVLAGLAGVWWAQAALGRWTALAVVLPAAVWTGYWLHALCLFGHEASHSNLVPSRRHNDLLGDVLVWVLFGSSTVHYRRVHMQHHVHLGDHEDTETTYFKCMSIRSLVEAMTGVYLVEALLRNRRRNADFVVPTERGELWIALRSALLHGTVVGLALWSGRYAVALTWVLGTICFFPLFAMVRTTVEHRRLDADCEVDFTRTEHGPVNRMFGDGILARTFGAAGFNKHLLHHWDPGISYTQLSAMERFIETTQLAPELRRSRTSYLRMMRELLAQARGA